MSSKRLIKLRQRLGVQTHLYNIRISASIEPFEDNMQRIAFPVLLLVLVVIYSKQSECSPISAGESPARYSHEYVYGLPLNLDILNYYLERQAEENARSDRDGRDYPFVRNSRSNSEGLREHFFSNWMKKGRGSIRLTK